MFPSELRSGAFHGSSGVICSFDLHCDANKDCKLPWKPKAIQIGSAFWISRKQGMKADALGVVSFSSSVYTMAGHKVASLS